MRPERLRQEDVIEHHATSPVAHRITPVRGYELFGSAEAPGGQAGISCVGSVRRYDSDRRLGGVRIEITADGYECFRFAVEELLQKQPDFESLSGTFHRSQVESFGPSASRSPYQGRFLLPRNWRRKGRF